jgi:hypothetical protein
MILMNAADLRRFALRDWGLLAAGKAGYWARLRAEHGGGEAIRVADKLRREVQRQHPDWPSEEDRRRDLETHVRVSAAFRSVEVRRRP